jgi:acetyl-CoA carboxylase biotin carboxyl carrier protein
MNLDEIKKLIKIFEKSRIGELEIVQDNHKIKMTRTNQIDQNSSNMNGGNTTYILPPSQAQKQDTAEYSRTPAHTESTEPQKTETNDNYYEVRAPMVGTYYSSPSPDASPYVKIGDSVAVGQTLCIIEAMKLMNEIQSEKGGKVAKILVENAQPVEYNQILFLIEK